MDAQILLLIQYNSHPSSIEFFLLEMVATAKNNSIMSLKVIYLPSCPSAINNKLFCRHF